MLLCYAAVDLAFITDDVPKIVKKSNIFLLIMYRYSPWWGGYCSMTYIFTKMLSS